MTLRKLIVFVLAAGFIIIASTALYMMSVSSSLPQIMKVSDYKPLLVSNVYARGGEKLGEFAREKRLLIPYDKIPKKLVQAFLAAEDDQFFEHGGVNYVAIFRATLANLRAGHTVQGASTITQQVAKTFFLTPERTITRKLKEAMLAYRLEEHLRKEDILYLYLNQIFFGKNAYGVAAAAETYFRKSVDQLTIAEMAILASLPKAPSTTNPIHHPVRAKERQRYVIARMREVGYITKEEEQKALAEPVLVYLDQEWDEVAPHFIETLRQILVAELGENKVLDEGLKIYTSIDYKAQKDAQAQVRAGLREVDKRIGWRGATRNIQGEEDVAKFLKSTRTALKQLKMPTRILMPDETKVVEPPLVVFHKKDAEGNIVSNIPDYVSKDQIVDAIVTRVDDNWKVVFVRFAEGQGLIDISEMAWARKPDPNVPSDKAPPLQKPSQALKVGDVIEVKVVADKFPGVRLTKEYTALKTRSKGPVQPLDFNIAEYAHCQLEQRPQVEGALLSVDQKTQEVIAMVGGYEFVHKENEFNRAVQARRQTGSSFKSIVYASALDKGYTPVSPIQDSPVVFEDAVGSEGQDESAAKKAWKPHNYAGKFTGEILMRNALVRSMNIPTVKIIEDIGVDWAMDYSRRLGIFSPLNPDFTMALGSSGVTLYEMTKVFSEFGRNGLRARPLVVQKILDYDGKQISGPISLDRRFQKEIDELDKTYEERRQQYLAEQQLVQQTNDANGGATAGQPNIGDSPADKRKQKPKFFFENPDQLISPATAYLITTMLSATIFDENGTGARARALGRPVAGKTGTTNGYFDTWFIGYTPQIATGVWVGYNEEKSMGAGEAGGRTALPIWLGFMKSVHEGLPAQEFPVPADIVFANIDNETGKLASATSRHIVKQAFLRGTEPGQSSASSPTTEDTDFLKQDFTE